MHPTASTQPGQTAKDDQQYVIEDIVPGELILLRIVPRQGFDAAVVLRDGLQEVARTYHIGRMTGINDMFGSGTSHTRGLIIEVKHRND